MIEFRMPSLGADMEAGTVLEWRIAPGDHVHRGQVVALIDTDKAEIEAEIWEEGVVDQIVVPPGQKVAVGTVLATLKGAEGAEAAEAPPAQTPTAAPPAEPTAAPPAEPTPAPPAEPPPPRPASPASGVRSTPRARRLARELGVDLASVQGTGDGGAVTGEDVEAVAGPRPAPAPRPAAETAAPGREAARLASMRQAIGAAMARSKREIPHYYLETEIDMGRALAWLEEQNLSRPVEERILPAALLLRAVAQALSKVSELNGHWVDGALQPADGVHLGVAISLRGGGLIAPAIHRAETRSLEELMAALRDLVRRAREGGLRSSELSDATATVTNLGDTGVEKVFGVIYPPQVALVGFGRIVERPWARDGMLGVRPVVTATLSADHRASDGLRGARFLRAIARHLEEPEP